MVQVSWRRVLVGVFGAALLALGGCSSTRSSTRVDEKWLARVPESQLEGVRQAQLVQQKAADELTRSKVAVQDAKNARELAHRNEEAAKARAKAAKASLSAALSRGQGVEIARAQEELRRADQEASVARAEADFRERAVKTLEALDRLRARELAVADAELAQQQYLALQRSGDVRARELSGAGFARAVADARREADETQRNVESLLQEERLARAQWQELRDQTRAYGGSGLVPPGPSR